MQKTEANGLLYKTIRRDASFSRQGLAEYLCLFRKWPATEAEAALAEPVLHTHEGFPLEAWQRYASPVWFDLDQKDVLNVAIAREDGDEKHLCPSSLDLVRRPIDLWSNPGDVVADLFAGIGSVGKVALEMGRRFVGGELKESYFRTGVRNLQRREAESDRPTLFGLSAVGG